MRPLGDEVEIPTLDGTDKLRIPAGTQNGKTFRIRGRGVPYLKRNGRGDLVVTTKLVVPTHLNERQKSLLREFGRTLQENSTSSAKNIIDKFKDALQS